MKGKPHSILEELICYEMEFKERIGRDAKIVHVPRFRRGEVLEAFLKIGCCPYEWVSVGGFNLASTPARFWDRNYIEVE